MALPSVDSILARKKPRNSRRVKKDGTEIRGISPIYRLLKKLCLPKKRSLDGTKIGWDRAFPLGRNSSFLFALFKCESRRKKLE
jgi:hypothetical protein